MSEKKVFEVVITGGPCGGKSSGMSVLAQSLQEHGFGVVVVPEAARMVIGGAFRDIGEIACENYKCYLELQREIFLFQNKLRGSFLSLANLRPEEWVVVLYDRGPLDAGAYMHEGELETIMTAQGYSREYFLRLFDGVIHLVTAADGAERHYFQDAERHETLDRARELDIRTQHMWWGVNHLHVIDNSTDFRGKILRTKQALARILGIPVPLEIERKYLVGAFDTKHPAIRNAVSSRIEQIYLTSVDDNEVCRIRKRGNEGSWNYYLTKKFYIRPGVRNEIERKIEASMYEGLSKLKDSKRGVIRKTRSCFVWDNQYFELDIFDEPQGLTLLEIELTEENKEVSLPSFINVLKDVTEDQKYGNHSIAERLV